MPKTLLQQEVTMRSRQGWGDDKIMKGGRVMTKGQQSSHVLGKLFINQIYLHKIAIIHVQWIYHPMKFLNYFL